MAGVESEIAEPVVDRPLTTTRYQFAVEVACSMVLAVVGFLSYPIVSWETPPQVVYGVVVLGCCLALIWRRRNPRIVLVTVAVLLVVHVLVVDQLSVFAGLVCLAAAYTTQTQVIPPWRWISATAIFAGSAWAVLFVSNDVLLSALSTKLIVVLVAWALIAVAALLGSIRRRNRARVEGAFERVSLLEAQQDTEHRLAALQERHRIAREMHDILGHSLNIIAVQAEGARYALRSAPHQTDQALAAIGRLSREAVDEVRDLLDVLYTDEPSAELTPTPHLRDIPGLIGSYRHTGANIRLHHEGDPDNVPSQVGLAAYRIVQEALTNAIKHAGGVPIMVRIDIRTNAVDLLIVNSVRAARAVAVPRRGRGHGLIGMEERVRALGGSIDTGPNTTIGGWRVAATLPWTR
ncbi:sensor histidine kinase [Cryobacterium luteum]